MSKFVPFFFLLVVSAKGFRRVGLTKCHYSCAFREGKFLRQGGQAGKGKRG